MLDYLPRYTIYLIQFGPIRVQPFKFITTSYLYVFGKGLGTFGLTLIIALKGYGKSTNLKQKI